MRFQHLIRSTTADMVTKISGTTLETKPTYTAYPAGSRQCIGGILRQTDWLVNGRPNSSFKNVPNTPFSYPTWRGRRPLGLRS